MTDIAKRWRPVPRYGGTLVESDLQWQRVQVLMQDMVDKAIADARARGCDVEVWGDEIIITEPRNDK
jgi:hypothetical protein